MGGWEFLRRAFLGGTTGVTPGLVAYLAYDKQLGEGWFLLLGVPLAFVGVWPAVGLVVALIFGGERLEAFLEAVFDVIWGNQGHRGPSRLSLTLEKLRFVRRMRKEKDPLAAEWRLLAEIERERGPQAREAAARTLDAEDTSRGRVGASDARVACEDSSLLF
jgi:hypothetical protein